MKTLIKTRYTEKEFSMIVAIAIRDYYLGSTMEQNIGMSEDGDVDYQFNVHGFVDVVFFNADGGQHFDDNSDLTDAGVWGNEMLNYIAECIYESGYDSDDYEIEWAK